ncbi:alpha/beta hydrolase family protein [Vreelandella nanhaiensis]|uniref:Alpha/beta fold hydrolase n=1 Tax=Vreelandella nanhaiensis TaxID=1258546 RepID=A0A433KPX3_9GAMM|nr:alpha/beta fold hydrolase [Halomonas nanhaiensis]RUR31681.1 alpha/beta fold hydrolase [Halomonas nanhaiensis]
MKTTKKTISPCYPLVVTGQLLRRTYWQAPLVLAFGVSVISSNPAQAEQLESSSLAGAEDSAEVALEHPSEHLLVSDFPGTSRDADLAVWQEYIPDIQDIEITSSADEASQPALYYDSGSDEEKPLLMVLHSWSTNYLQNIDIPLGEFAVANDWVFIHPDFRGQNDGRPESTASELVMSDMEDALEYARENANIDESRIYLLGYSGGAMNALHFASRNPEVFAGVAAWVPVYDLLTWYHWNAERGEKYADEIAGACGGEPTEGSEARDECVQRSVSAHLPDVEGELRVLLAHGINDTTVPPEQALHAFNDLAAEEDRISQDLIDQLEENREVPEKLAERSTHEERNFRYFDEADAAVLLYLQSGPAELVLFDGEHEMLYRPGLEWLARQQR